MRFSGWLGSVHSIFRRRLLGFASRKQRQLRDARKDLRQVETLEQRRVLAFDFVSAYVADDSPFYVTNVTTDAELAEAPQQLTLRFTPGVKIDPTSLGGISIVRSGGADDPFGTAGSFDDVAVAPGALLVDDFPSQNQVVIRFAETLPDDIYRITLSSTTTQDSDGETEVISGLKTIATIAAAPEAFRDGDSFSFDVRLSLGQQVAAVVPQPISRDPDDLTAGLSQDRDVIEVYFDRSESLNQASAETPGFYRLITVDKATGADEPASEKNPTSVVYDPAAHKASLTFASGDLADGKLYRLEIGGPGILAAPAAVAETLVDHDSFTTAQSLGLVSVAGLEVSGSIDPRAEIALPGDLPSLYYPTQDGTIDEPGHRDVPIEDSNHGLPSIVTTAPPAVGGFSIDLTFGTGLSNEVIELVEQAAARWEQVIVGDLSDQVHPITGQAIDDIVIDVQAGLLDDDDGTDGQFGTLANARPVNLRGGGDANPLLPFTGEIGIDMADVNNGQFVDIMINEIGHALGFTASSIALNLIQENGFTGANAVREYLSLGIVAFANAVPLETDGGAGTAGAHWDEAEFDDELMTGYIGTDNPLSRITVGAFDDMGYVVDYAQADPYLNLLPEPLGTAGVIHTIPFNFRSDYGSDPQGNPLQNAITAEQQLRVREIFDLFSRYAGIRFVETANEGITVATGDTRVISDNTPTTSVNGLARGGIDNGTVSGDALAIVNSNIDWGESEYGGGYFREAIRQIGQVLGLWHSYDVPSIMGESLPGENVFPSDYDILHLQQLYPRAGTEIDVYSFTLADDGQFQAETFAQRLSAEASTLDTVLSIYDVSGSLISRNDDSFGRDSRVALELAAGDYYVAVSSTGNTSFNLDVTNSGLGGFTQGAYDLRLDHTPVATAATTIVDASGTPLDGDRDGKAGGAFNFHFRTAAAADTIYVDKIATDVLADVDTAADGTAEIELDNTSGIVDGMLVFGEGVPEGTTVLSNDSATEVTLSAAVTVLAATKLRFVTPGDGTLANPYLTIADALAAATSNTAIIRILGNDGSELTGTSNNSGRPSLRPNVLVNELDPYHYYVGYDRQGNPLADGANLTVPAGVTLMLDAGATFRMAAANVEVGSSSELVSRAGAALQVLGTPTKAVTFSSTLTDQGYDDTTPTQVPRPRGGDWGGIVLRADSDWQPAGSLAHDTLRPVLNSISNAEIIYAGGQVVVDAEVQSFAALQIEDTRPIVAFSTIADSAGLAVSATPNSFQESHGRVGPEFRGNRLIANSINGVFIAIATEFGRPLDKLDVSARFASTEVVYVLQESLVIAGGAGSYYEDEAGDIRARPSGRLQIDPGVVVKLQSSRIELERGGSQLIAEGVGNDRVIFTSFADNRFGAGGDFDTNGNLPDKFDDFGNVINTLTTGDWGGIILNAGASASIADAYLAFGGGEVPLEGGLDDFNVIEVHQADLRLVDTRIEANASGLAETSRNYRGTNEAATIFIRGAQPIIVGNDFRNNAGAMISANVNSLSDIEQGDSGRQTGPIDRYLQFEGNRGPLLRANRISNDTTDGGALAGLAVRAEEITVESVWDDTDIVHVVTDEIIVNNFHTATGLRLESDPAASLVVKLDGPNAGFTASGELLDIDDRIGGTVQVVGQPGFPVVLTSLADDSVGASVDLLGFPVTDTNVDGDATEAAAGDWRSLKFLPLANDRNVAIVNESELAYTSGQDDNNVIISAEALGILAPNYATGTNTWESAQEKTGDENRRQGFEVHGAIAYDDPTDVDIYTFDGYAGSEVWIDVDKTSSSLDTMVELLDASGRVLARSADSQTDTGSVTGVRVAAEPGGTAEVTGAEVTVVASAAEVIGVGAIIVGETEDALGAVSEATGVAALVQGIDQPAVGAAVDVRGVAGEVTADSDAATMTINTAEFDGQLAGARVFLNGVDSERTVDAITGNSVALTGGNLNVVTGDVVAFEIGGAAIAATRIWVSDNSLATNGGDLYIDGVDSGVNVIGTLAGDVVVLAGQATLGGGSTSDVGLGFFGITSQQTNRVMVANTAGIADNVQVNGVTGMPVNTRVATNGVDAARSTVTLNQTVTFTGTDNELKFGYRANPGVEVIQLDTTEFDDTTLNLNNLFGQTLNLNGEEQTGVSVVSISNNMITFTGDTVDVAHGDVLAFGFGAGSIDATRVWVADAARATVGGSVHVDGADSTETVVAGDAHAAANLLAANVVTLSGQITVNDADDLAFGFNGAQVTTDAVRVNDTTGIVVGAPVNGLPGVPAETLVMNVDAGTGTVEFDQEITLGNLGAETLAFGFNDATVNIDTTDLATPANTIAAGATVTRNGVAVPGLTVGNVTGNVVTFNAQVNLFSHGDEIGLLLDGSGQGAVNYDRFYLDDSALAVSLDAGAVVEYVGNATDRVTRVPNVASPNGLLAFDSDLNVSNADQLVFGFVGGQSVETRRVVVENNTDPLFADVGTGVPVNLVGSGAMDPRVPDGTVVDGNPGLTPDTTWSVVALSSTVTVADSDELGFGFSGTEVVLADVTGLNDGEGVGGPGVPAGTTIDAGGVDAVNSVVTLNQSVAVEDAAVLTFTKQEFDVLAAPDAAGISILPGSLSGVVYDGNTAIQTFTAGRDGVLTLTTIGNPPSRVTAASVDYETGVISMDFDAAPRRTIRVEVDYEYANVALQTLGFAWNAATAAWDNGAFPLTKDAYRGGDHYTTNPRDAGMRVTLPGTQGTQQKYFIRVRSQPAAGVDRAGHEANLVDAGLVDDGLTSGSYELRVRTRQQDEKPGSTVRYADIRYPQIGIDVVGLPNSSPLVGTTGEHANNANDLQANAQQLGNLLTSDRNTISVAGAISDEADVDWYTFTLGYEDIQSLLGHNDATKTWATVFDIDYADGFRGDLTLSVFDGSGRLIYVGRDSDIADDQPGAGQGSDYDDLSRGSFGKLDPFIGSVQLDAGSTTGITYYVAVSSNERLPAELDATFNATATNPGVRLQPIDSVRRVVNDPIGGDGPLAIVDTSSEIALATHVVPYTLADVVLFVSSGGSINTVDPFTGGVETQIGTYARIGDIDMRTDGRLFSYVGVTGDEANVGVLQEIDPGDGTILSSTGDAVPSVPDEPTPEDFWKLTSDTVDALAIRRTGVGAYTNSIYYSMRAGVNSLLYSANTAGSAARGAGGGSLRGQITAAAGEVTVVGHTTGLQFLGETGQLYAVSSRGQFYKVDTGNGEASAVTDFSYLEDIDGFQGLATAPVNLEGGRYQGMFFAITNNGRLVCIDPDGGQAGEAVLLDNVFDTDADGIADSFLSRPTGIGSPTGLAFSPLDINLWHATNGQAGGELYFGIENDGTGTRANWYGAPGQYGTVDYANYDWQADLTSGAIGDNYDLPGGAHGSLITGSFSLAGTSYTDKPTLYFDYTLDTEEGPGLPETSLDAARVSVSVDGGQTWELIASNKWFDLPPVASVSSAIGTPVNQHVQELFDSTGATRQARIDLGKYAGAANVQLRFDFATAGGFDLTDNASITPDASRVVVATTGNQVQLDSLDGLEVGMQVRLGGTQLIADGDGDGLADPVAVPGGTRVRSLDVATNQILLEDADGVAAALMLEPGHLLEFYRMPRVAKYGVGLAADNADSSLDRDEERGQDNAHGGFRVDNITVGFAERGERVTGAAVASTGFFDIGTPTTTAYPQQTLRGEYQLEIRRGTEYASHPVQTTTSDAFASGGLTIDRQFDTNDRLVSAPVARPLTLEQNSLATIDGVTIEVFGNGQVQTGTAGAWLAAAPGLAGTSHNLLAWNVDLPGNDAAYLQYSVEHDGGEVFAPLPATFTVDASHPLPGGNGVAVSLDGGTTWRAVDVFAGVERRVVDLSAVVGPLTATTVIGFFQSGTLTTADGGGVRISNLGISTAPPTIGTGTIGDANSRSPLEQGQFVVQSNIITAAASYGVRVDAGRDTETDPDGNYFGTTNAPHLGVARNLPVLNNSRLVPGLVVANNVISGSKTAGVLYAGNAGEVDVPESVVPYARIFNNTVVGVVTNDAGTEAFDGVKPDRLVGTIADETWVLKARLDTQFESISKIRLRDSGSEAGLGGGESGFDLDAILLSTVEIVDASSVNTLTPIEVFDFSSTGTTFTPGSQAGDTEEPLAGTGNGEIDFTVATLGEFDRVGDPLSGFASLGDGGAIEFELTEPLPMDGPVYLYVGEGVDLGESLIDGIEVFGVLRNRTAEGDGIVVTDGAGPTILNNVFADLGTAVKVDQSSREDAAGNQRTVIGTSAFYNVGVEVGGATQTRGMTLENDPFVNALAGNYYPSGNSPIVDSSLNSLQDRNAYTVVTQPLGIAPSPIVTPTHDLFGQLRGDDPDQASAPGLGLNVFKDRGAIERIDRSAPTARLIGPLDQATQAPLDDKDSSVDSVRLEGREARGVQQFVIQLEDIGVGIDRASVVKEAITVLRDDEALSEGVDYFFQFNANTNQIILASTVVFELGDYVVELRPDVADRQLVDLAGNQLLANANGANANGVGEFFTSFAISLADVPSAPTGVTAMAADGVAQLKWNAPNTSPSTSIVRYDIEYSLDGGQNWQGWSPAGGGDVTASTVEVPWPNNEARLYRVRGVNNVGTGLGAWSVDVAATASQPLNVVGTPGLGEVSLTWAAPVNNGGQVITSYIIYRRPAEEVSDEGEWIRVPQGPSSTSVTVTGLEKGVAQEFLVVANTAAGEGEKSAVSAAVTPEGTPDAPVDLASAIEPDGAITLTWTIPSDGGRAITEYQVSYSDGNKETTVSVSTNQITLDSLVRGMDYTIEIWAVNVHGLGTRSEAFQVTAPDIIASGPIVNAVQPGFDSLVISWIAPTLPAGDLPVIDYVVQTSLDQVNWITQIDGFGIDTTTTITNLARTDGDHFVRVAARNGIPGVADQDLHFSAPAGPVQPLALAGGVQNLVGISGNGQVTLSWDQPADNGGSTVTDYVTEYQDATGWHTFNDEVRSTTGATVTGLVNGTSYQFRVAAVTAAGHGATVVTGPLVPVGPPAAVTGLQATAGIEQVTLTWLAPATNGGQAVNAYQVEYATSATGPWSVFSGDADPTDLTAIVTGLQKQTPYFFRVSAQNAEGIGEPSGVVSGTPMGLPEAPDAPTNLEVVEGFGQLQVDWNAGADNGAVITDYVIGYATSLSGPWIQYSDGTSAATSAVLSDLPAGVGLYIRVAAKNAAGTGSYASPVGPVLMAAVPTMPTGVVAQALDDGRIGLSWQAPENDGGAPVIDYVIEYRRNEGTVWSVYGDGSSNARTATVDGFPRTYGPYVFRVRAVNAYGQSLASAESSPVAPFAAPGRVEGLSVEPTDSAIAVSWTPPSDDGGTAVSDYVIQYSSTGGASWVTVADGTGTDTSTVISGLSNGANYLVRVFAGNTVRYGAPQQAGPVMPLALPAAPTGLQVTANSGTASLVWTAPAVTGGLSVTDYVIEYRVAGNQNAWAQWNDGVTTNPATIVTGLTNNSVYEFRVAARTAAGTGQAVRSDGVLIGPRAAAPTRFSGALENGVVRLRWVAPVTASTYPITDYRVEYRANGIGDWSVAADQPGSGDPTDVLSYMTGLEPGIAYQFRVAAVTAVGVGNYAVYEPLLTPSA